MSEHEEVQNEVLMVFDNPDKVINRSSGNSSFMPQWPFRLLVCGPPNSGKRNMLLNVIFRLDPPPSAIHIIHIDPFTTEYNQLELLGCPLYFYSPEDFITADNVSNPPLPETIGNIELTEDDEIDTTLFGTDPLVIIDEVTGDMLNKENKTRFDRLMNYVSSHKNTTVMCSIQAITSLPPRCRRAFNQYVLWKQSDHDANVMASNRAGVPYEMLQDLFKLCTNKHDSIWVDCDKANDAAGRFRLNMIYPITTNSSVLVSEYTN